MLAIAILVGKGNGFELQSFQPLRHRICERINRITLLCHGELHGLLHQHLVGLRIHYLYLHLALLHGRACIVHLHGERKHVFFTDKSGQMQFGGEGLAGNYLFTQCAHTHIAGVRQTIQVPSCQTLWHGKRDCHPTLGIGAQLGHEHGGLAEIRSHIHTSKNVIFLNLCRFFQLCHVGTWTINFDIPLSTTRKCPFKQHDSILSVKVILVKGTILILGYLGIPDIEFHFA